MSRIPETKSTPNTTRKTPAKPGGTKRPPAQPTTRRAARPKTARKKRSSASDEWYTPTSLVDQLGVLLGVEFVVDVAATAAAAKAPVFYDQAADGLAQDWHAAASSYGASAACWMNPPYSDVRPWLAKAVETAAAGTTVVALLRASTETKWFERYAWTSASEILFFTGRLSFERPGEEEAGAANHASVLVVWRPGHVGPPEVGRLDTSGRRIPSGGSGGASAVVPEPADDLLEPVDGHEVREAAAPQQRGDRRVRQTSRFRDPAGRTLADLVAEPQHELTQRLDLRGSVVGQRAVGPLTRGDVLARVLLQAATTRHAATVGAAAAPAVQAALDALASGRKKGHTVRPVEQTFGSEQGEVRR